MKKFVIFIMLFFSAVTQGYAVSQKVTNIQGQFVIRAALMRNGTEQIQYLLQTAHERYYLKFTDGAPTTIKTDDIVRVRQARLVKERTRQILILSVNDIELLKQAVAIPTAIGPQKTIVFLVNFQDKPNDRPFTPEQMLQLYFTDISNMFLEHSYQQTKLVGRIAPKWNVVAVNSTASCDTIVDNVPPLADAIATQRGIDLTQYNRKVYLFPYNANCPWIGLGIVGGLNTMAWINGDTSTGTSGHELGHNFGLWHSKLLVCANSPNSGTCQEDEYGDRSDIMGAYANKAHFNAFQKERLGWLNYKVSPPITTVTGSGIYKISPFEIKDLSPKALKILKRAGRNDYYYLEYRQAIGCDAELGCTSCDMTKGVIIHQGNTTVANSSLVLDMSPTDGSRRRIALLPGASFRDALAPNGGVTMKVLSVDNTGATVSITYG